MIRLIPRSLWLLLLGTCALAGCAGNTLVPLCRPTPMRPPVIDTIPADSAH